MYLSMKILILFCAISICSSDINCRTTGWWVLLPFSKSILQSFLSESKEKLDFNSSNPLAKYMQNDQHPVYFEFNQQNHCEDSSLPPYIANITEQTFVEFKLEIPYLIRQNKTVMFKPLIYQNSILNVEASKLVYGLPAYFATMQANFQNNTYSISYQRGSVQLYFIPLTSNLLPFGSPETANFSSFVDANVSPWVTYPPLQETKCASNIYNFTQTGFLRPVNMTLNILGNIFHSIPSGVYTNIGNQPLGAWQIDVHTRITSTYQCP